MRRLPLLCLALLLAIPAVRGEEGGPADLLPTLGAIQRLDPRFDGLVPKAAVIEVLASGFEWAEGPVWVKADGAVLFSDIPRNRVNRWKQGEGLSTYLEVLRAEDALIANRRAVAGLETRAFVLDIALVRALGGGFNADQA
jgi:hypothetical protein